MLNLWMKWRYKNITLALLGIVTAIVLYQFEEFHEFLLHLGGFGYIGAFMAGILYVSVFTVTIASLILLILAEQYPVFYIGIVAGIGAIVGDFLIFRFVKDGLVDELKILRKDIASIFKKGKSLDSSKSKDVRSIFHSKYFSWVSPFLGLLILLSPFPDEVGVGLLGLSQIKTRYLVVILLIIKPTSVFLVLSSSAFIRP